MADKNKKAAKIEKEVSKLDSIKSFFSSVTENVVDGAAVVTESIKNNKKKMYVAGTEIVEDANDKIHQYSDKVLFQNEKKKMEARQKEIEYEFGSLTLAHYLANESLHKSYLTTKAVDTLVQEFSENGKAIVALDKKIKKLNS